MSKANLVRVRKAAILTHRWLGVGFCLLFAIWFASGIVMMYFDYPRVQAAARLLRSAPLDAGQVRIPVRRAFEETGETRPPDYARLTMLDGRPVYRFHYGRLQRVVRADDGSIVKGIDAGAARRIASAWTGLPAASARFEGSLREEDQWTLNKAVRPLRPFLKFSWDDGQEVYVSQVTGEVMQYTTRGTRMGAYFGAIPHWIYFTAIRKETGSWRALVIALSAGGTVMAVFGLVAGFWLYSPSRKYRHRSGPSSIPYAGGKRWHTMLGLVFGLATFTWILSGMFSMNPLQWAPESGPDLEFARKLSGAAWSATAWENDPPAAALQRVSGRISVKELELRMLGGEPVYLAVESPGRSLFLAPGREASPEAPLAQVVSRLLPQAGLERVGQYDLYYIDRHGQKPLPALRVDLADGSSHYLDVRTGAVVASYAGLGRLNRWLYHGLHSLDLPVLYRHRPLWDVVVLCLMLGGTALSFTGVWIGWRRLQTKLKPQRKSLVAAQPSP